MHYLPGFVPGSQNIFRPAKIAVAPTGGLAGSGELHVGAIYGADGRVERALSVAAPAIVVTRALARALADAGLTVVAVGATSDNGRPPAGPDFIVQADLEQIEVNQRFGAEQTVHGQYFKMNSLVRLRVGLRSRAGAVLYSGQVAGGESEPPPPVGHEVFFPLETDPAESLSVAMSRAIGSLMLEPKFQAALPLRAGDFRPAPNPTATPAAAGRRR